MGKEDFFGGKKWSLFFRLPLFSSSLPFQKACEEERRKRGRGGEGESKKVNLSMQERIENAGFACFFF